MDQNTRVCKICGKEYPYCRTELKQGEIFRWQDVACCPEHGSEYFACIAESRNEKPAAKDVEPVTEETPVEEPKIESGDSQKGTARKNRK